MRNFKLNIILELLMVIVSVIFLLSSCKTSEEEWDENSRCKRLDKINSIQYHVNVGVLKRS